MNPYIPYIYTWAAIALVVLVLAVYRISLGSHDDLVVHLAAGDAPTPPSQQVRAHKIDRLDHWGPALTIVAVLYGFTLLGVYFYHVWFTGYQIPNQ
jgi:hypothetical protein